ncbi:hypothetical protein BKA69DRAFT_1125711 [Paraphysoderma sedebokerense]|nr:hypothetical protein BKA69DRAFT_1125711 [Paraphysoderma sedebokerense]
MLVIFSLFCVLSIDAFSNAEVQETRNSQFSSQSQDGIYSYHFGPAGLPQSYLHGHPSGTSKSFRIGDFEWGYIYVLDVPGIKKDEIEVSVDIDQGVLSVWANKTCGAQDGSHCIPRSFSIAAPLFHNVDISTRQISVTEEQDHKQVKTQKAKKIHAFVGDGVLTVVFPKREKIRKPVVLIEVKDVGGELFPRREEMEDAVLKEEEKWRQEQGTEKRKEEEWKIKDYVREVEKLVYGWRGTQGERPAS